MKPPDIETISIEDRDMCYQLDNIRPGQQIIYAVGGPSNRTAFRMAYTLYLQGRVLLFQRTDKPPPKTGEPPRAFQYIAIGLWPPFIPVVEVERQ